MRFVKRIAADALLATLMLILGSIIWGGADWLLLYADMKEKFVSLWEYPHEAITFAWMVGFVSMGFRDA